MATPRSNDPVTDTVVAVVLAAGAGSRFAGPTHKLDALVGGQPVVTRAAQAAYDSAIGPVVVVTGAPRPTRLPAAVAVAVNDRWAHGQQSSLRRGIDWAREQGATRVVVGLGDQPFVTADDWRAVAVAGARSPIAVAVFDDGVGGTRRGHPVSLDRTVWGLLPPDGDEGARPLMRIRPDLVVEVPCSGSPDDIDTLEDLRRWQSNS
jgi:CTP:molybdopterin cytidylyltransferase MocA